MALLSISEVARQAGVRPSAIRYYEKLRILPAPKRASGQRRYDISAVHRLAVLRRAQEAGFTLEEVRELFFDIGNLSSKWHRLAEKKMAELEARMEQMRSMKTLLHKLQTCCTCDTVEQCGARIRVK